jgi:hypothetical protein
MLARVVEILGVVCLTGLAVLGVQIARGGKKSLVWVGLLVSVGLLFLNAKLEDETDRGIVATIYCAIVQCVSDPRPRPTDPTPKAPPSNFDGSDILGNLLRDAPLDSRAGVDVGVTGRWVDSTGQSFRFEHQWVSLIVTDPQGFVSSSGSFRNNVVRWTTGGMTCEGELSADAQSISGTCTSNGESKPFDLRRER